MINPADGDSFISHVLGGKELSFGADFGIAWSSETGVQFQGEAGFEIAIPLNLTAGPVTVDQLASCCRPARKARSLWRR